MAKCLRCGYEGKMHVLGNMLCSTPLNRLTNEIQFETKNGVSYPTNIYEKQEERSLNIEKLLCLSCGYVFEQVNQETIKYLNDFS
jgi:ferredoxin-like protein FixX